MIGYYDLCKKILDKGYVKKGRNGTTLELNGETVKSQILCSEMVISKKFIPFKLNMAELFWMINGSKTLKELQDQGVKYWDKFAKEDGTLGPVYGSQWRSFYGVDQLKNLVEGIKNDPNSRRLIVTAWNPGQQGDMALPPCPTFFQVFIRQNKYLDFSLYQRSADMFLGVPFDILQYRVLAMMLAYSNGYDPGEYTITYGSAHIYEEHIIPVKKMLENETYSWSKIIVPRNKDFFDIKQEDIKLIDYHHSGKIKAQLKV